MRHRGIAILVGVWVSFQALTVWGTTPGGTVFPLALTEPDVGASIGGGAYPGVVHPAAVVSGGRAGAGAADGDRV